MHRHSAAAATIGYALLTVTLTWPLARGAPASLPWNITSVQSGSVAGLLKVIVILLCAALTGLLLGWTFQVTVFGVDLKVTSIGRVLVLGMLLFVVQLVISDRARATTRGWFGSPVGCFALVSVFALMMSFGPRIDSHGRTPPQHRDTRIEGAEVYRFLASLPPSSAVIEMPFGEVAFEARYMFYSTLHWRRLVNGYSGGAPAQYSLWAEGFKDVLDRPQSAWQAVVESRVTHISWCTKAATWMVVGARSASGCARTTGGSWRSLAPTECSRLIDGPGLDPG
jgi:hypothetical protein